MRLSCTVFEIQPVFVKSRRFWPTPPAFGAFVGGDRGRISRRSFRIRKLDSPVYRVVLFVILRLAVLVDTDSGAARIL